MIKVVSVQPTTVGSIVLFFANNEELKAIFVIKSHQTISINKRKCRQYIKSLTGNLNIIFFTFQPKISYFNLSILLAKISLTGDGYSHIQIWKRLTSSSSIIYKP